MALASPSHPCNLLSALRQRTPTVLPIILSLNPNPFAPSCPPSLSLSLSRALSRALSLARARSLSRRPKQGCRQCPANATSAIGLAEQTGYSFTLNPNFKPVIHFAHSIVLSALSLGWRF